MSITLFSIMWGKISNSFINLWSFFSNPVSEEIKNMFDGVEILEDLSEIFSAALELIVGDSTLLDLMFYSLIGVLTYIFVTWILNLVT